MFNGAVGSSWSGIDLRQNLEDGRDLSDTNIAITQSEFVDTLSIQIPIQIQIHVRNIVLSHCISIHGITIITGYMVERARM